MIGCRDPLGRPAAGARRPRRRHHPRLGDLRARHHRRALRARRGAGRDGYRHAGGDREPVPVRRGEAALLHLRIRLFLAAGFHRRGARRLRGAQAHRRRARPRARRRRRPGRAGARFRHAGGDRIRRGGGAPLRPRHHPQPLRRAHLHRAERGDPRHGRAPQAQRQSRRARRQARDPGRRFRSSAARRR